MSARKGKANAAVSRIFAVLEHVVNAERPLSAVDLIASLGVPKATLHRMLASFEDLELVVREPGGRRYMAGRRQVDLAVRTLSNSSLWAARRAVLQALADEVGETCNLTMMAGNEIIYLDRVESELPLRFHIKPGHVPLHCSCSGKLFLSFIPPAKRRVLLHELPLRRYTPQTVVDPERLDEELREIRQKKLSVDNEGFFAGLIGIAVPVLDPRRRICAAVAINVPTARTNIKQALVHVAPMRRAAAAMSQIFFPGAGVPR